MPTLLLLFKTRSLYLTFKSILKVKSCEDFKHFFSIGNSFFTFYSREITEYTHKRLDKNINSDFIFLKSSILEITYICLK